MSTRWDPELYRRYENLRSRPFHDLVAQIGDTGSVRSVVDLGCGDGTLTATLAARWPDAEVTGVDSSGEMVAAARARGLAGSVDVVHADLAEWEPKNPVDVIVSNAALQWVPEHWNLFGRFIGWLDPAGTFAFQVPGNLDAPSHAILRDMRLSPRWRDAVGSGADRRRNVLEPAEYLAVLSDAGCRVDVWETTYLQVLTGDDPVLEWVSGTALRPVQDSLDQAQFTEFRSEYGQRLRDAYPTSADGSTIFPFRRIFVVASVA